MPSQRLCPDDGSVLEDKLPPEERLCGQTLAGKYRIEGFLSQGGMGAVYRATHVMLGKPVALKLIRPEIVTSPEVVRRFQREARAASLLSHPNIVTIYDLGQLEDGTLYLAMELCAGMSLKDLMVAEGPLAPRRAVRLCRAIAGALALAHKNRIVHRDLKPHNVMVAHDAEGQETPKLLDFGIAKAVETDGATLTSTGMVLGTPRYLSPEQAKGLSVDGRSDLYSLGIIFYEMLVGRVPFDDPSVPSLLVKHMAEPPRPPSDAAPRRPPGHRVDRPAPAREGPGPPLPERRGPVRGPRGSRSGRAGRQRADACGRYDTEPRAPRPERGGGRDDHRRAAVPSGGRPHPRRHPEGYLAYPAGLDDGPETGTARGQAEREPARSRLAQRRRDPARGQCRATALDAIEARSAAQDSGCRGPRRIGPAAHERARVSEVARTRGRCSAAQCAIPSLRGSEAGRKRAPGRRARGHDGARAARRADAARSASIRSLTSTATASPCRGSTAPATMASTTARCEASTTSTASRAPSAGSAALRSPPSAPAPARLRGPSASGPISA